MESQKDDIDVETKEEITFGDISTHEKIINDDSFDHSPTKEVYFDEMTVKR